MSKFALNPWNPLTDKLDLKVLGKLGEETGELSSAVSRCIIQGVDEVEPVTKKPNRKWLEDEIADVLGNIELVIEHFGLDANRIQERKEDKKVHLTAWHKMD